jgi:hypothetical protein
MRNLKNKSKKPCNEAGDEFKVDKFELSKKQMERMEDFAFEMCADILFDYSGEGMEGRKCLAFVLKDCPTHAIFRFGIYFNYFFPYNKRKKTAIYNNNNLLIDYMLLCVKSHTKGNKTIIYFPDVIFNPSKVNNARWSVPVEDVGVYEQWRLEELRFERINYPD